MISFVKFIWLFDCFVITLIVSIFKVLYFISSHTLVINLTYLFQYNISFLTNLSIHIFLIINLIPYSIMICNYHLVFSSVFVLIHSITLVTLLVFINNLSIALIFIATLLLTYYYWVICYLFIVT